MSRQFSESSALSMLGRRIEDPPIAWLMRIALERPELISLAAGFTDNASLPVSETRLIVDGLLKKRSVGAPALQYGPNAGDPELIQFTAGRTVELDGAGNPSGLARRTLMTHGSQQLIYLLSEALLDEGDIVLLEDPSYFVYFGITQSKGVQCRGVAMDDEGVNLEALEQRLKELKKSGEIRRLKLFYMVTYFQNPSGVTTTLERKREVLRLIRSYESAAGHPIHILEDAAYRELGFSGKSVPTSLTLDGADDRVIYTSTYSKPFATGIRAGFGIMPAKLLPILSNLKGNHDFGTANLVQQILKTALKTGVYQEHVARVRKRYESKSRVMVKAIRESFPDWVDWQVPDGGLYVWASLRKSMNTGMKSKFFQRAMDAGVLYVPGQLCYADDPTRPRPTHQMRLSYGAASANAIREGISRIGKLLG